ncbi:MAG: hypothetical protein EBQ86_00795 [Betaproteobacteria bacterium]|nr:hypothetical protein [Betaproteobacteria bacterium]
MPLLSPEILAYVGVSTVTQFACDPVEQGAVRRYAQAIMDDDPNYGADAPTNTPWAGPIAPPLFPNHAQRNALGTPDIVQQRAHDPNFDGTGGQTNGLPPIEPLKNFSVLNGGAQFELYRYARHGEKVQVTQRYAQITEKTTAKGSMILVTVEAEFRTDNNELLLLARRTLIRRPA